MSVRGGVGVFYDAIQAGSMNNRIVDLTPFSPQIALTQPQGSFSNPYLGITNPYPSPFPPPPNTPFPAPVLVVSWDAANDYKGRTPVMYNWNLMIERQVMGWMLRGGYVGSHSSHLMESTELNPAIYTPGDTRSTDARRLFKDYGSMSLVSHDINSSFNSMQLSAQRRMRRGLTLLVNYTWSKSLDTAPPGGIAGPGASGSPILWFQPGRHQYDHGPSEFDHKHRFVTSYVYDLPRLAGSNAVVRTVAGGWQLSGIVSYYSGAPLTITAGRDQTQSGIGADRANYLGGNPYAPGACGNTVRCVNFLSPAAFGLPNVGTLGNVGKGMFRGPNFFTWDGGLFKEFPLRAERLRLQFRAEYFNIANRANFNAPNTTQSNSGFGQITGAQDPRIGQLALKLLF